MSAKGVAPKCRTCGNHPRSADHRQACGGRTVPAKKQSKRTRAANTIAREERIATQIEATTSQIVAGMTCLVCMTIYRHTPMPSYQEPDAKQGKYDLTRQLPGTSANFPVCDSCLPWQWRSQAHRYGMEKQLVEFYQGVFV